MQDDVSMCALAKDAPVMIAWEAYKTSPDYANTRNWALREAHVDGSLWAAFFAGFNALARTAPAVSGEELEAFREQTDLVERLCDAVDRAENDIGGEGALAVLKLLGPAWERSRAALERLTNQGTDR
jgi:hypothetical protein